MVALTKEVTLSSLNSSLNNSKFVSTRVNSDYAANKEVVETEENTFFEGTAKIARTVLGRLNQAHPGIKWFLFFNFIVAPVLVFAAMQIVAAHSPSVSKSLLISSGAKSVTADELVQSVVIKGKTVFWLDRLSGDTYSHSSIQEGVDVVTYVPQSSAAPYLSTPDLVITTYRNLGIFNSQLRPLEGTKDNTVELFGRVEVSYNPASTNHATVFFKNRPEVAVISYPANQAVSTLVNDAQSLTPIK